MQGDIIAILNDSGECVAEYSYDAWGNCTVTKDTNTIALDNPIRYRGYYYDVHIGLYYLQSRFYDANTGRFINADEPTLIGANGGMVSNNLFAYCDNNPVNKADPTGHYVGSLALSGSLITSLSGALTGIMTGISAAIAGIKTAIAISWFVPVCIAAAAIAIVGIVYVVKQVKSLMKCAAKVISAVKSKVKSKGINSKKLSNYTVYVIARHKTKDVVYVGITKNYKSRKKQHTGKGKRFNGYDMMPIATGLTKSQARAMEQTIISAYTLDTLKNMINSISPKKWSKFKTEFKQMQTLMQSWIDPE